MVIKFMKDRGIDSIRHIAEKIKAEMDLFRPKVPLLVALRTRGMTDRHWTAISDKAGFEVKPFGSDFTFKKVLGMGN